MNIKEAIGPKNLHPIEGEKVKSIHETPNGTLFGCRRYAGYCANKRPSDKIIYPGLCITCPAFILIKKGKENEER